MIDTVIQGGTVIDPEAGTATRSDIGLAHGRIAAVGPSIPVATAARSVDATGLYVAPGFVDLHTHVHFRTHTTSVHADSLAATAGVTTWIDAGSANAGTIDSFRENVVDPSTCRILSLIRMTSIRGSERLTDAHPRITAAVVTRNRDIVVGIKVSMGQCDIRRLELALEAAEQSGLPLMVHIAQEPPPIAEVLKRLRSGDIVTHAYTGQTMRLVDGQGVRTDALRARDRGVLVDIGHGAGSFSWASAEVLWGAGFRPNTISTDVWQVSVNGPMFDLPTCISKFLHLGMSLIDAVRAVTSAAAEAIAMTGAFGTLRPGSPADLVLFRLVEGGFPLYDTAGERREASQLLRVEETLVAGRPVPRRAPPQPPEWLQFAMRDGSLEENPDGGIRPEVLRLQEELRARGQTPDQMAPGLGRHIFA